jgi:hypothetical protein
MQIPSKYDYEQNINPCWVKFIGMGLECDTLDVVIFRICFCFVNLWPHFDKATFELKSIQIWLDQNFIFFYVHNFSKE